jgi:hypothetical protein
MITVVDGLEMYAIHHTQSIVCDVCGASASSAEVTKEAHLAGEVPYIMATRQNAQKIGWTYADGKDRCPKCSASTGDSGQ